MSCVGYYRPVHYILLFLATHTPLDVIIAIPKTHTPCYWWSKIPLYIGARVQLFPVPTLALHKELVLACIAQHHLAELGANLAMCHSEALQSISNIDVV